MFRNKYQHTSPLSLSLCGDRRRYHYGNLTGQVRDRIKGTNDDASKDSSTEFSPQKSVSKNG